MYIKMVCDRCGLVGWNGGQAMECQECVRLRSKYERVALRYAKALEIMTAQKKTTVASEDIRLRTAANEAHIDCDIAWLDLEKHKRVHAKAN